MSEGKLGEGAHPLLKNIVLNVGARGVLIILSIAITPVLVRRLGTDRFGIYALATGLGAGLTNILAFGLIPPIVAMLSRSLSREDNELTQKIVRTAFTLFAVIGIGGATAVSLAVPVIVTRLLKIPAGLQDEAARVLWISAAGLGLNLVFAVFTAVPYALQRYDIIASRVVGLTIMSTAATVVYVLIDANLTGVMVIQFVSGIGGLLFYYLVSRQHLVGVRFLPGFDRATFRRLGRFVAFKSVGDAALVFGSRFDQFAIGSILNVGAVGLYAVPANACQRILQLLGEVAAPMFPRMSALESDDERRLVLLHGSRLVALLSSFVTATVMVLAEPILRVWIGGNPGVVIADQASQVLRLLAFAMYTQSVAVVAGLYCEAIQRPAVNNSFIVLGAIVQVPAILLLVPRFGINGAALGILLSSVVQTVPFLILVANRIAAVGISRLLNEALGRSLVSALAAAAAGLAVRSLATGLTTLVMTSVIMTIVYLAAAIATGALRAGDLDHLQKVLPIRLKTLPGHCLVMRLLRR